jgi:hypothetical protein
MMMQQKIQAATKRIKPQNNLKQIRQAKEKIGAVAQSLLAEKVNSTYSPTINKRLYGIKPLQDSP